MPFTKRFPTVAGFLLACLLLFPVVCASNANNSPESVKKRILILNSYHKEFRWSDEIVEGFKSGLKPMEGEVELFIEYMDRKRYLKNEYLDRLRDLYAYKYKSVKFDLIFSTDDDAFHFLLAHGRSLFPGVPAVFSGVSHFAPSMIEGYGDITGVLEVIDRKATIESALSLHPDTRRIFLITDRTTTGRTNRIHLERLAEEFSGSVEFVFLDDDSNPGPSDLAEKLANAPPSTIAYYSDFFQDGNGRFLQFEKLLPELSRASRIPIYSHGSMYLGLGIIGGKLNSGVIHGETAAKLALRVLRGEKASSVPVIVDSRNRYMFDHIQLKRFGIDESKLPSDSIIVNEPSSFYGQWKSLFWSVSFFILFQAVVIMFLLAAVAKRKRAEQALRESEEKYRLLIENQTDFLAQIDSRGRFLFVSPSLCELLGRSAEELIGMEFIPLIHEDDRKLAEAAMGNLLKPPHIGWLEHRVMTQKGLRWLSWSGKSVLDEHGNVVAITSVGRDISERRQAEEELKESEERLKTLFGEALNPVMLVDESGGYIDANRAALNFFECEKEELGRRSIRDLVPSSFVMTPNGLQPKSLPEQTIEVQYFANGKAKTLLLNLVPLTVSGRALLYAIGQDITERKIMEEEQRRIGETLRALVQASPIAIVALDSEDRITLWSPAASRIFGCEEAEILNRPISSGDWEILGKCLAIRHQVSSGETVSRQEVSFIGKDGAKMDLSVSIAPLRDFEGRLTGVMSLMEDITDHKKLEEQFLQSQKMEAIGRLAGGVAHDFNNLLTSIQGDSDLILMSLKNNDSLQGYVNEIQKAANRATSLTRQLLAFSRKQILQPMVLDLNEVITDLGKMLRRLIGEDIEFVTALSPALWKVKADPGQMEQVIMNLAVNSRDAMPQGGRLVIETANVYLTEYDASAHDLDLTPGPYVMLSVSDTGIGMDKETQAHMFEPFFTTKEKGKGTGLGLAMLYGIIKQSDGFIWLYSEPGMGTTFKIYLPRGDGSQEAPRRTDRADGLLSGSETILITEDNDIVRDLLCNVLRRYGYKVLEANSGEDAIQVFRTLKAPLDLLLTDVVMPGISGLVLAQRLQKEDAGLKVIYMSGYTDDAIVQHGVLEAGIHFIQKPFNLEKLVRKIRDVLNGELSEPPSHDSHPDSHRI